MARATTLYICQQCEHQTTKWHGKCPQCDSWGSLVESVQALSKSSPRSLKKLSSVKLVPLTSISTKATKRTITKISELDRVFGGGIVPGQVTLIAGEPGIGKSTILLQLADKLNNTLYVSGEESVSQIKLRADRLGIKKKGIGLLEETDIDTILNTIPGLQGQALQALIIDSIQTMSTRDLSGMAGSVGQVRECTYRLIRLAKSQNLPIFIVGHVTKQGSVAGPAVLMHLVDTVLWFEGDKNSSLRLLRAVKNRFGPTDEVGIFEMSGLGLISQNSPEKLFLSGIRKSVPGTATASVLQGTRPILVEIQTLIVPTKLAFPKRIAQGIDSKRFELLLAVLERRCGLSMSKYDCFVNVAGGISIKNDPSTDLATCFSLASSYFDKSLPKKSVAIGEVGLLGDIRDVSSHDKRVKEARRLGYSTIIDSKRGKYLNQAIKNFLK